jgi:hypothetical protein
MKIKIKPDKEKARSLQIMAKTSLSRLDKTNKLDYPSNTINDYYDIFHKLCESLSLLKGVKFKGNGAHKELINYIVRKYNFTYQNKLFLQGMRELRNRISYEGFQIHKNYIILNQKQINIITQKLLKFNQEEA